MSGESVAIKTLNALNFSNIYIYDHFLYLGLLALIQQILLQLSLHMIFPLTSSIFSLPQTILPFSFS